MWSRVRSAIWLVVCLPLFVGGGLTTVRGQGGDCTALAQETYQQLITLCGDIAPGQACYGGGTVAVERRTDLELVAETPFAQPGDVIAVRDLAALTTQSYDAASNSWGAALVRLEPGAAVELPEVAAADDALPPTEVPTPTPAPQFAVPAGVAVTSATGAVTAGGNVNLRGGPGTTYDAVGTLTAGQRRAVIGQATGADGFVWYRLDDGEWVRSDIIAYDPAGVVEPASGAASAGAAADAGAVDTAGESGIVTILLLGEAQLLAPPVGGPTLIEQGVFNFSTGPDVPDCDGLPLSNLFIETTPGTTTPLLINGSLIVFQSTALATATPGGTMTLSTLVGELTVVDGGFTGTIPTGATQPLMLGGADGFDTLGSAGGAVLNGAYWGDAIYPGDLPPMGDGSTFGSGPLPSITVQPHGLALLPGQQQQYWCIGHNQYGFQYPVPASGWEADGGTITGDGLFTAGAGGNAYVLCYLGDFSLHGSTDVPILGGLDPNMASITITPPDSMLYTGDSTDFFATLDDGQGGSYAVSPSWSADGGFLTPHYGVNYTATQAGDFTLTAEVTVGDQTITGTADITVSQPPDRVLTRIGVSPPRATIGTRQEINFSAMGYDQHGEPMPVNPAWSVSGDVPHLGSNSIVFSTPGTYTVTATQGGVSGTATIIVSAESGVNRVVINPDWARVRPGETRSFGATIYRFNGSPDTFGSFSWSTSGGSITSSGDHNATYTAPTTPGTYTITVTTGSGASDTATIYVEPEHTVTDLSVQPGNAVVSPGGTQVLAVTGVNDEGNDAGSLTNEVEWQVSGGSVDSSGTYTAPDDTGSYEVIASYENPDGSTVSDNISVTVTDNDALATIVVSPARAVLQPQAWQQFTARGYDAENNPVPVAPTWSSTGWITTDGGFTYDDAGTYTVTATQGSVSGAATVIVTPAAGMGSAVITPERAVLRPGDTVQFTATYFAADGSPADTTFTWSATGDSVIDGGEYTAPTEPGAYTVGATAADGVSATASVTIAPQLSLTGIAADYQWWTVGWGPGGYGEWSEGQTFTITGTDAEGNQTGSLNDDVNWTATGGSVDEHGTYTPPREEGNYEVTAIYENSDGSILSDTIEIIVTYNDNDLARIEVSPAAVTLRPQAWQQFTARGYDAENNPVPVAPTWSSTGYITEGGRFIYGDGGTYTVTATQGSVSGAATVVVSTESQLARIVVSPARVTLRPSQTQQFTATGYDQFGSEMPVNPSWSGSGGPPDATAGVTTDGEFVSEVAGAFTVEAAQDGVVGTGAVTVEPTPEVASLSITPDDLIVRPGDEVQFTATGHDAEGFPTAWLIMAWQASGGVIDDDARYIAPGEEGDYTITATTETIDGETLTQSTTVSVQQGPEQVLTRITVEPLRTDIPIRLGWPDFRAHGYDQFGDPMPIDPVWTMTMSADGWTQTGHFTTFTYTTPGSYTITATEDGVSGSAVLELSLYHADVETLLLHPRRAVLHPGETVQFSALYIAGGQPTTIPVTWRANGGSITSGGTFTATTTPGSYFVSVSCVAPSGAIINGTIAVEVREPY